MKKIENLEELKNGEYYWLVSKMIYDNGQHSNTKIIERFITDNPLPQFGNKIWAHEENNQAMEKYDIYGPIPKPFTDHINNSSEFEKVFGNNIELTDLIAIIRDNFTNEIEKYIPDSSAVSSPECVLYAVYKSLEDKLKITKEKK